MTLAAQLVVVIVVDDAFVVVLVLVLVHVAAVDPRNIPLKFGSVTAEILMKLSYRWWWWCKVIFVSNQTFVMLC